MIIPITSWCVESIITVVLGRVTASRPTFDRLGVPPGGVSVGGDKEGSNLERLLVKLQLQVRGRAVMLALKGLNQPSNHRFNIRLQALLLSDLQFWNVFTPNVRLKQH